MNFYIQHFKAIFQDLEGWHAFVADFFVLARGDEDLLGRLGLDALEVPDLSLLPSVRLPEDILELDVQGALVPCHQLEKKRASLQNLPPPEKIDDHHMLSKEIMSIFWSSCM